VVNRRNRARNLVRVPCAIYGRRLVPICYHGYKHLVKVNLSFGLKPDLAFRLSFGLKLGLSGKIKSPIVFRQLVL